MQAATQAALTSRELSEMVDLLSASSTTEQTNFVLSQPREALRQSQDSYVHHWDPRLSVAGKERLREVRLSFRCSKAACFRLFVSFGGRVGIALLASSRGERGWKNST